MNQESIGLIIFALIALGAVFAFIIVFGGPSDTGMLSGTQKIGTSTLKNRDAFQACSAGTNCIDGLPGIPTGGWDNTLQLYQCRCQVSEPSFIFYRSAYGPG